MITITKNPSNSWKTTFYNILAIGEIDKNSKLLLSYKEWEDIIVNERLKIETNWNKLVIIIDADIAEW